MSGAVRWTPPATLVQGNALTVPDSLPDGCVSLIATSPPFFGLRSYGTPAQVWGGDSACAHEWADAPAANPRSRTNPTDYGKQAHLPGDAAQASPGQYCRQCGAWLGELGQEPTVAEYVAHLVSVFTAWRRVLHPTGVLFVNLGDSYSNDGKWGGKSGGKNGTSAAGGYDRVRKSRAAELGPKQLLGVPWRFAFAMQDAGWILRNDIIWGKPNAMPESVTDRFTKSHEYVFLFARQERYYFDHIAVQEPSSGQRGGGFSRAYAEQQPEHGGMHLARPEDTGTRNRRDVWEIATVPFAGAHYATWPPALVLPMVLAGSSARGVCSGCGAPWARVTERTPMQIKHGPKAGDYGSRTTDGLSGTMVAPAAARTIGWQPTCRCADPSPRPALVADPFSGAGTTGGVAVQQGRHYLGVDLNADPAITQARVGRVQLALLTEDVA